MLKIFVFIDIWFVKQDIQKWLKNKDMQFFRENLKIKRKKDNIFLTLRSGDLNPKFLVIFPPMIWIFCEVRSPRSNQNKLLKEKSFKLHVKNLLKTGQKLTKT